jgi:ATP-dependent Clp protease adaptor protein ClpS
MPVAIPDIDVSQDSELAKPARVLLYNDDWHTFEDVIKQLIKATGCDEATAEGHAWTVHTAGKALVFEGPRDECQRVANVLREIRLQVEVDWDE